MVVRPVREGVLVEVDAVRDHLSESKSNQSADLTLRFDRRGRYQQDSFGLSTRFPFSFLTKSRPVPLGREVMDYP